MTDEGSVGVGKDAASFDDTRDDHAPPEPHTLSVGAAIALVGTIQSILWLDYDGWNPDKEWDSETIELVDQAMRTAGMGPR